MRPIIQFDPPPSMTYSRDVARDQWIGCNTAFRLTVRAETVRELFTLFQDKLNEAVVGLVFDHENLTLFMEEYGFRLIRLGLPLADEPANYDVPFIAQFVGRVQ